MVARPDQREHFLKRMATGDESINLKHEMQTGWLLGSAAFCSGTAWQPIVNALHDDMGLTFNQTVAGNVALCGLAFGALAGRGLAAGAMYAMAVSHSST